MLFCVTVTDVVYVHKFDLQAANNKDSIFFSDRIFTNLGMDFGSAYYKLLRDNVHSLSEMKLCTCNHQCSIRGINLRLADANSLINAVSECKIRLVRIYSKK